jgi:hypothetical protein
MKPNKPDPLNQPMPPNNTFAQILQDAQRERTARRMAKQQYADYWQTRNQDLYAQRPTAPFTPETDRPPPHQQREWIRRRIKEVLADE